jgi:hypothetical protein
MGDEEFIRPETFYFFVSNKKTLNSNNILCFTDCPKKANKFFENYPEEEKDLSVFICKQIFREDFRSGKHYSLGPVSDRHL